MKITFGRLFELGLIATTKSAEELRPFIEWVQTALDNIARTLVQNVTLTDNIDAQVVSFTARDSSSYPASVKFRKRPIVLLLGKQFPTSPIITSYTWEQQDDNNVKVTVNFATVPSQGVTVTLLAFFA
jgi:hypothetical protein